MNHKLQVSTVTNNGVNSVVRDADSTSKLEIVNHDAGPERADAADFVGKNNSRGGSCFAESPITQAEAPVPRSTNPAETPGRGWPDPRLGEIEHAQPRAVVPLVRCEVALSDGYDPTGEHAVACGVAAQVVCEYCGPMCSSCAEETFCFHGRHKLGPLPEDDGAPVARKHWRAVNEVVYVEIKCPNCRRVRLALPKKHRPKAIRKCPVCKAKGPAEYLAHGFTRRRLPFHEIFTTEKELPEGVEFKRRVPWDRRPAWFVEEE